MPPENLLGFGAADFFELALAAGLAALAFFARRSIIRLARKLATKTAWCMLLLALLPIVLRLAMLPRHPIPAPEVYDEFGHLLVADTLLHFRLSNPTHPLHQFFESFFVLQEPSYASIYPIGQGVLLAIGHAMFGSAWAGVLLATGAMCALCYWMLRAWTSPEWALLGGMLAVIEFGPLNSWMNGYWGGAGAACAGCLVFGGLPRIRAGSRSLYGALLGLGIGWHWHIRPYETVFLVLSALLFLGRDWRWAISALYVMIPAIGLTLLQNKAVTGNWTTLPYQLSQYQYGVPAGFTWQSPPEPHARLTPEQQMQYNMQLSFRPRGGETIGSYIARLAYRVRYYRFFFLPALYVALPFFFLKLREWRFVWATLTLALFMLGDNFYGFFEPHYFGALVCLYVLVSLAGLERIHRLSGDAALLIILLCLAHFVLWYGRSFFVLPAANPRAQIERQLSQSPGKQLVFVRYWPQHRFQDEWVYNAADIDGARIVWARDLGADEDRSLLKYYSDRTAWLLEPDAAPPKLGPYRPESAPVPPTAHQPTVNPPLRFEQVH